MTMKAKSYLLVQLFICIVFFYAKPQFVQAQTVKQLTFEEAFEIAEQNSPDIQRARLSLDRSRELLNAQEASLKSRFSFTMEPFFFSHQREFNTFFSTWNTSELKSSSGTFTIAQPILLTDGTLALQNQLSWRDAYSEFQGSESETFSNNLYISYNQPIFTYNRTRLALDEVKLDLENNALNYQIQELNLERFVAQSFYTVYQNKMSLQVAKEEFQNREQSYQIIKNKVDAGLAAMEELYQAELDRTTSQATVQNAQVTLENSLDELKRLLGIDLFDEINVAAEISQDPVAVDLNKAINHGLANRLELRQRNINLALSQANVVRAAATNEFKGNISLIYGIIGNDYSLSHVYDVPTQNQQVSLSFEIPIWDWGEQKSRTKAAEASLKQSNLTLEEEKRTMIIAIRTAYRNLQNQALQIELAVKNLESAQLTYDINLERYQNGDLTSMDLNLFQNQLSQKKIGLVNAQINYKIQLLVLKIESLWDFEKDRPVIMLNND
jgi:outer membrane protein TolC